jgi:hypothetical protein
LTISRAAPARDGGAEISAPGDEPDDDWPDDEEDGAEEAPWGRALAPRPRGFGAWAAKDASMTNTPITINPAKIGSSFLIACNFTCFANFSKGENKARRTRGQCQNKEPQSADVLARRLWRHHLTIIGSHMRILNFRHIANKARAKKTAPKARLFIGNKIQLPNPAA